MFFNKKGTAVINSHLVSERVSSDHFRFLCLLRPNIMFLFIFTGGPTDVAAVAGTTKQPTKQTNTFLIKNYFEFARFSRRLK